MVFICTRPPLSLFAYRLDDHVASVEHEGIEFEILAQEPRPGRLLLPREGAVRRRATRYWILRITAFVTLQPSGIREPSSWINP